MKLKMEKKTTDLLMLKLFFQKKKNKPGNFFLSLNMISF